MQGHGSPLHVSSLSLSLLVSVAMVTMRSIIMATKMLKVPKFNKMTSLRFGHFAPALRAAERPLDHEDEAATLDLMVVLPGPPNTPISTSDAMQTGGTQ